MSFFGSMSTKSTSQEHWVPIEASNHATEREQSFCLLNQRLDAALSDLGRIDYQLSAAFARLRADVSAETHDNLQGQVSQALEPGLRAAIAQLAGEITKAMQIADEVIANAGHAGKLRLPQQQ